MLARCMADRGVVFRVALPKSSRFSSRAGSPKLWGFAGPVLVPIHAGGGGRITGFDMPFAAEIPTKKNPNYFDNYSVFAVFQALSVLGGGGVKPRVHPRLGNLLARIALA